MFTAGEADLSGTTALWPLSFSVSLYLSPYIYLSVSGVTSIFTAGEADLSGITGRKDLYVSDAVHKAMLEVQREKE